MSGAEAVFAPDDFAPLRAALSESAVITDQDVIALYVVDQRDLLRGRTSAVLRPSTTAEVQAIVRFAAERGLGVVPQGGNTGYCGGATPDMSGRQLVVSFERMNRIRSVDVLGHTMAADAGVILVDAQRAAEAADLFLPLSLGAEGSCRLGGNVGTNAGGLSVLRYGMMRDLVLGLEVVLPNGELLDELRSLRKNNTGYDLKQAFIGAEGTLGLVTGVLLKLSPRIVRRATAWVQLAQGAPIAEMLAIVRRETGDLVSSFEFITTPSVELALSDTPQGGLAAGPGGALLIELASSTKRIELDELLFGALEAPIERGWVQDAFLAQSDRQRTEMWRLRESIPEGEKRVGGSVKHDISVPLAAVQEFLQRGVEAVRQHDPNLKLSVYGHVGDGNVHFNILVPPGRDRLDFTHEIEGGLSLVLYEIAQALGGTFSGEHGVARLKRDLLERYASSTRLELMRRIKSAHDPKGIMNPGAVVDPAPSV
jgi:FAD/FMN-containing dehydrogenase